MTDAEVEKHFPVMGWRTKCGNRTWLPKKERIHDYVLLGKGEIRNSGTARGFIFGHQFACAKCGTDKFSAWKGPKMPAVEKFLGVSYGIQLLGKEKCTCNDNPRRLHQANAMGNVPVHPRQRTSGVCQ